MLGDDVLTPSPLQDDVYNPYYALIGQRLAIDSHGEQFTMQYALWDFMRSIGEKSVAGRSKMQADAGDDGLDDGENVSDKKIAHVARTYAWWIARGALSLNVLKSVDFTALKRRGNLFLQLLITNVLLSTQTTSPTLTSFTKGKGAEGDRKALEACVTRGTAGNIPLAQGLLFFITKELTSRDIQRINGKSAKTATARVEWAAGLACNVLQATASQGA